MIIKPSTVLIIFCNVLIFMLSEILLFWYQISKEVENIIIDKSLIVKNIITNSTLQQLLTDYTQSEGYQAVYNQSLIDSQERYDYNMHLTWQWMLIPFLIVIIILTLGVLYTLYVHRFTNNNTLKLDKTDLIIIAMVFLSFLTEIIFIFVLVMRYEYVSDGDVIIFLMNSNILTQIPR